jgi:segregation and condensation protein B
VFLSHFGFNTPRDLPDMEAHEDAGLLSKERLLAGELPDPLGAANEEETEEIGEEALDGDA